MEKKILVIGRHQTMMEKVVKLLENNGYKATGILTNEDALNYFIENVVDAVIIGGGVDEASREMFHIEFTKHNPKIKLIDAHPQTVLIDLKQALT